MEFTSEIRAAREGGVGIEIALTAIDFELGGSGIRADREFACFRLHCEGGRGVVDYSAYLRVDYEACGRGEGVRDLIHSVRDSV